MFKKKIIYIVVGVMATLSFSANPVSADIQKDNNSHDTSEVVRSSNSINQQVDSNKNSESDIVNQPQDSKINTDEKNQIDPKEQGNLKDDTKNEQGDSSDGTEVEENDITIDQYNDNVKSFKQVNMDQVKEILAEKDNQDRVMYIGRPTCYYCRQFSPELKNFNELIDGNLLYFNIDAEDGAHDYAFKEIGIPGTPTTMRVKNSTIVAGWIGGDITAEDLYNFLYSDESNKLAESVNISEVPSNNSTEIESSTFNENGADSSPIQEINQTEFNEDNNQMLQNKSDLQTNSQEQNNTKFSQNNFDDNVKNVDYAKSVLEKKNLSLNEDEIIQSVSLTKGYEDKNSEPKIYLKNENLENIKSSSNKVRMQSMKNTKVKSIRTKLAVNKINTISQKSNSSIVGATVTDHSKELPKTGEDNNFLVVIIGVCLILVGLFVHKLKIKLN